MTSQAEKAELLRSLHVPGDPLIVTNVWDAITARTVAAAPGVRAIATASHSVSFARGVEDGEGMSVEQALETAQLVVSAVDLPVSVDFERGYATTLPELESNIESLIATGAVGLNLEDTSASGTLFEREDAAARVAAVRSAATRAAVPLVLNARADGLVRGSSFDDTVERANAYLAAGADCIFFLGLSTEELVARAVAAVDGPISVFAGPTSPSLSRLAELGVARVSFGPSILGLTLALLQATATQLTARGDYPAELGFSY